MHGDLTEEEDQTLKKLIEKKRANLEILEWLKDGLIKDFQREKRIVEDYESRYRAGKFSKT